MNKIIILCILISLFQLFSLAGWSKDNSFRLHYIDFMPSVGSDYTMSYEKELQALSLNLAVDEFRKIDPKCEFTYEKYFPSNDNELWQLLDNISLSDKSIVIGVGKSQQARFVSKKLSGAGVPILSFAAATKELQSLNKLSFSTSNPVTEQVVAVSNSFKKNMCTAQNTLVLSNASDSFSAIILPDISKVLTGYKVVKYTKEIKNLNNFKCIYITNSISNSRSDFEYLKRNDFRGLVYGVTEWSMIKKELDNLIQIINPEFNILVPTGLNVSKSTKAKSILKRISVDTDSDFGAFAVYVYEAVLIGLASKCWQHSIEQVAVKNTRLPLIRKFHKMSNSGNLISDIEFLSYSKGVRN